MMLFKMSKHIAKLAIFENNRLTIGEQKNTIQNFYNILLMEFHLMFRDKYFEYRNKIFFLANIISSRAGNFFLVYWCGRSVE